jgi:hypothetical protein
MKVVPARRGIIRSPKLFSFSLEKSTYLQGGLSESPKLFSSSLRSHFFGDQLRHTVSGSVWSRCARQKASILITSSDSAKSPCGSFIITAGIHHECMVEASSMPTTECSHSIVSVQLRTLTIAVSVLDTFTTEGEEYSINAVIFQGNLMVPTVTTQFAAVGLTNN